MSTRRLQIALSAKARLVALARLFAAMLAFASGCKEQSGATPGQAATDYGSVREQVIRRVEAGEIKPDATGKAALPGNLKSASIDGLIWIGHDADAGWLVGFPIRKLKSVDFLLYAEKSITDKRKKFLMNGTELTLTRQVEGKWYEAFAIESTR